MNPFRAPPRHLSPWSTAHAFWGYDDDQSQCLIVTRTDPETGTILSRLVYDEFHGRYFAIFGSDKLPRVSTLFLEPQDAMDEADDLAKDAGYLLDTV